MVATRSAQNTDARLMARVAKGDSMAFKAVVDMFLKPSHALAYRILLDASEAEDVVQTAFVKLWREAHHYAPERASLKTWFHTIVLRTSLDHLRKRKLVQPLDDWAERLSSGDDAHLDLELKQQQQQLFVAVASLNPKQRAAIGLCYYDDFTQKEAAIMMGVHIKAFEGLLSRAKAALRQKLEVFNER